MRERVWAKKHEQGGRAKGEGEAGSQYDVGLDEDSIPVP